VTIEVPNGFKLIRMEYFDAITNGMFISLK